MEMEAFVNSHTVFNAILKNNSTARRMSQIDVWELMGSYQPGELRGTGWIPEKKDVSDVLEKRSYREIKPCGSR